MASLSDDETEANKDKDKERNIKVVVVGDGSSGKTSICQRFAKETFDRSYHQTIGLDFFSRRITLPNDEHVMLQVWDIGGQSIAGEMVEKYIYGAHAALLVYDVCNLKSFDNLSDWYSLIKRVTKEQDKPPYIHLCGNKVDLEIKRAVSIDMHKTWATNNHAGSSWTSAKNGDAVQLMFKQLAADTLNIPLQKTDLEGDIAIVKGEVSHDVTPLRRARVDQSRSTAVCSIQ